MDLTPDFVKEKVDVVGDTLLPFKSELRYLKSYEDFMKWRAEKNVTSLEENDLLTYFFELSGTYKPSTLWSVYSMLKTTLSSKHNVNLKNYERLTSFLKERARGFRSKRSNVFTNQQVETFLKAAPDDIYLAMKVLLILGISGACRGNKLINLKVSDIEKQGEILLVKLRGTENETSSDRTFFIREEYVNTIQKYINLRPIDIETNRLFIKYMNGKCFRQVMGKNKIAAIPKEIATYLKLPNPHQYSGHCFRRTSATLMANSGADIMAIKRTGGWKASRVAAGYIEEAMDNNITATDSMNQLYTYPPQPSTSLEIEISRTTTKSPPYII